ncbi:CGGC domain-containing protein [Eubacteriaceae bacterium ES3]|nr:CGGC domain-containing protein [Eubacteriaceae bacterium ES3]
MKIGLIRCMKANKGMPVMDELLEMLRENGIENISPADISLSGLNSCGGCPGFKALSNTEDLVKHGADTIIFISPILKNNSKTYHCPHLKRMVEAAKSKLGEDIIVLQYAKR